MYEPKHPPHEDNRQANRASGIWNKVEEHAQWSQIAQSMLYHHRMGRRWSGAQISAYKAFHEQVAKRRADQAANEERKSNGKA